MWRLVRDHRGRPRLRSTTRADAWPAGEPMRAVCHRHRGATVPAVSCSCGLYATSSPEALVRAGVINASTVVVGPVAMWGRVVEHARGARARFAYPARLALVCGPCLADGTGAVASTHVFRSGDDLVAMCPAHRGSAMGATPASSVQAELLAAYGVELLPLERVERAFRRRPTGRPRTQVITPRGIAEGVIRAIGFVFQAVMFVWVLSGFLGIAMMLFAGVLGMFDRTVDVRAVPVRAISAEGASVLRATLSWSPFGLAASDGWMADPSLILPEVPRVAFLCGRSDGPVVHIVENCFRAAVDLWGFATEEPPHGPERDCAEGWLAYTREPDRWICWHAVPGETPDVRAWTGADGEWFDEDGG